MPSHDFQEAPVRRRQDHALILSDLLELACAEAFRARETLEASSPPGRLVSRHPETMVTVTRAIRT
jgi:hypothetical protein